MLNKKTTNDSLLAAIESCDAESAIKGGNFVSAMSETISQISQGMID